MKKEPNVRYAPVARRIRKGEWTTYGDISAAATGSKRRARAVGREAAESDSFPNAHRILASDGTVSRGPGGNTEAARRRLEAEGVGFDRLGRADPARRVHWDELVRRARRRPALGH
jgi:alkylated DNA nucleotide flippase Atl1